MKVTDQYVFFYKEWPGNYTRCSFNWEFDGKKNQFFCTEQAFMYAKAITFKDYDAADRILKSGKPSECRYIGREVKNYVDFVWERVRFDIMYSCNNAKYIQCRELREKLLNPEYIRLTYVEASPIDRIWGIGMDENDSRIDDNKNWKGRNLLGKILTTIRNEQYFG